MHSLSALVVLANTGGCLGFVDRTPLLSFGNVPLERTCITCTTGTATNRALTKKQGNKLSIRKVRKTMDYQKILHVMTKNLLVC